MTVAIVPDWIDVGPGKELATGSRRNDGFRDGTKNADDQRMLTLLTLLTQREEFVLVSRRRTW